MKQGGPPLAGGALRNVAKPVAFYANTERPPRNLHQSDPWMTQSMRNQPSNNDSDLSRPAASVIDEARGVLILRRTYAKGFALGFSLGAFAMFSVCMTCFMVVRQLK
jgi:hypothetical protein